MNRFVFLRKMQFSYCKNNGFENMEDVSAKNIFVKSIQIKKIDEVKE